MGRRPRPDLVEARRNLAALINKELERGQRGDGSKERDWQPWTNQGFADRTVSAEAAVRSWRDQAHPIRPKNILPILKVFYGDLTKFTEARSTMMAAWREAGGIVENEPPVTSLRTIRGSVFSEFAEIVDLAISQPTPDNAGNLLVPFTLRIHPDRHCAFGEDKIEIGVTNPYLLVESRHWRPSQDSIFRGKRNSNFRGVGLPGAIEIVAPVDNLGRIDGLPLEDEPKITMEPLIETDDGPITFSVRVRRDGFKVTPCCVSEITDAQKVVLDAIFASAVPRDAKNRLIIASETVTRRGMKGVA